MKNRQTFFEKGIIMISILYGAGVMVSSLNGQSMSLPETTTAVNQSGLTRAGLVKKATEVELEKRVQVKPEELPEKVRNTLNDKSYVGWTISDAYLVTADDGAQYYELVVRKADEQSRMKIDKNGQILN